PFEGVTPADARRDPPDLHTPPMQFAMHNARVSPALESLIFKCLAKQKEARYPSMSLVSRDLETML
ncbi:MAG: hypothetical protein KDL10_11585, partial [Kiritimatiellae bacterium]|nr:hypothetical protein [Kiritimatiellia bacterium]